MYTCLEQRMAQTRLDLLPPFIPDPQAPVSTAEQQAFYDAMAALYRLAADEPLRFVPALHEDDAYPNRFNKTPYGKPELLQNQKKFLKAVDAVVQNLFLLEQGQTVSWNRRQKAVLDALGLSASALPAAGRWLYPLRPLGAAAVRAGAVHSRWPWALAGTLCRHAAGGTDLCKRARQGLRRLRVLRADRQNRAAAARGRRRAGGGGDAAAVPVFPRL